MAIGVRSRVLGVSDSVASKAIWSVRVGLGFGSVGSGSGTGSCSQECEQLAIALSVTMAGVEHLNLCLYKKEWLWVRFPAARNFTKSLDSGVFLPEMP
jgi:hypothetical protein